MAIRKFDRSFAPQHRQISYLNKNFTQWRQSLIDYAKTYFRDTYNDFNEASPGMMFIEMAAYVGDVLSYYIDTQFRENLLQYAEEQDSIIAMAQAFGYKPHPTTAANCYVDMYQLCPAGDVTTNFAPDSRFMLRLAANTVVSSTQFGTINFRTIAETNFADPTDREITVHQVNAQNKPLTYLIKKSVKVIAGDIKQYSVTFGTAQKFSKLTIPDTNVIDIVSVVDSNGFTWTEVDYLAQDLILTAQDNTNPTSIVGQSVPPSYLVKVTRTPRRFVSRYDKDFKLELQFGSGILDDSSGLINLEPGKVASDEYQVNLASTALDPSDFLSSRSYGLAPSNINMTISYTTGGGLVSNVPTNTINKIATVQVLNDRSVLSLSENSLFNDIIASLAVNNSQPATGGKDTDTVEEIRQNAMAFFNAQNRVVNAQDYTVRTYAMPGKYGAVAKAFVLQDHQINNIIQTSTTAFPSGSAFVEDPVSRNVINLYVLGYNQNKKLSTLNMDVKTNLRTYIDQYRMLTDEIRIMDAFVVNIGVNFKIVVFKGYNMNDALVRAIDALKNFFSIDRWQINQPIILSDVINEIANVEGVQSVTNVEIVNKYLFTNGRDYNPYFYDIGAATFNGIVYPSLDPCIFECRYPENDIVGSATQ
jgi:hypothetical protein